MTDKPILILTGGLEGRTALHIETLLADKGLSHHDVVIIDATKHNTIESIKREIEGHSGKTIAIDDVIKMLEDSEPKSKPFVIKAMPRYNEEFVTRKELEAHPFSKFIEKGKKKKW